jgi:hypothetical protein
MYWQILGAILTAYLIRELFKAALQTYYHDVLAWFNNKSVTYKAVISSIFAIACVLALIELILLSLNILPIK